MRYPHAPIESTRAVAGNNGDHAAEFIGGGAIIGSIVGAIAGGGKGAAIGAAAGAAGTAGLLTRGRFVRVPRLVVDLQARPRSEYWCS
jgi:outer membrane lipoprotein SlyB